jgi:hypothetical protein
MMKKLTFAAVLAIAGTAAQAEYYVAFTEAGVCSAVNRNIQNDLKQSIPTFGRNAGAELQVIKSILGGNIYQIARMRNGEEELIIMTDNIATCRPVNEMARKQKD